MSITNYGELKTAVANWSDRTNLTTRIPEFIAIAESEINSTVRVRDMECRVTSAVSTEYFDLPTDFMEIRNIQLNTDPVARLEFMTPNQMDVFAPSATPGKPKKYAVFGTEVQLKPIPDASYTLEIAYIKRYTAFSADSDTNWLLTNHPQLYLYQTLVVLANYIGDKEKLVEWSALYESALSGLNKQHDKGRYSGPLVRRPDVGRE